MVKSAKFVPARVSVPNAKGSVLILVTVTVFAGEVVVSGNAPKSKTVGATSMPNFLPKMTLSPVVEPVFPKGSVTVKRLRRPAGAPVKVSAGARPPLRKPGGAAGSWRKVLKALPKGTMPFPSAGAKSGGTEKRSRVKTHLVSCC